jgi:hypothetical protein
VTFDGTTEPIWFYGFNLEKGFGDLECMVNNVSNLRLMSMKREGDGRIMEINNSSNVAVYTPGNLPSTPATGGYYRVLGTSNNVLLANMGVMTNYGTPGPTNYMLYEAITGQPVKTILWPNHVGLYKRGNIDDSVMFGGGGGGVPPSAPASLTATVFSSTQVDLAWPDVPTETQYRLERKIGAGAFAALTTKAANSTSHSDTTVAGNANYTYQIIADNANGSSSPTLSNSVTTPGSTTVTLVATIGTENGHIYESGETTEVGGSISTASGWVGDVSSDRQVRAIFSLDTSSIPDGATVLSATLRLKRELPIGANPFTWGGGCRVDIRNGGFNGNVALEATDFQAAASATNVASMSSPAANGDWSTGALNASGLTQINKIGKTQLRVYFATGDNDDAADSHMRFYGSGAAAGNRPELVVTYQ